MVRWGEQRAGAWAPHGFPTLIRHAHVPLALSRAQHVYYPRSRRVQQSRVCSGDGAQGQGQAPRWQGASAIAPESNLCDLFCATFQKPYQFAMAWPNANTPAKCTQTGSTNAPPHARCIVRQPVRKSLSLPLPSALLGFSEVTSLVPWRRSVSLAENRLFPSRRAWCSALP
ncbi:hypothetical protein PSPO01_01896 [Paraphaeosphaeria sporulosa]